MGYAERANREDRMGKRLQVKIVFRDNSEPLEFEAREVILTPSGNYVAIIDAPETPRGKIERNFGHTNILYFDTIRLDKEDEDARDKDTTQRKKLIITPPGKAETN